MANSGSKNKLSEVIDKTLHVGPQVITRRGEKVVIMISVNDYEEKVSKQKRLGDFFKDSPLSSGITLERD